MAEAPPTPLSLQSAQVATDSFTGLTTDMLWTIIHRLVATLWKRDIDNFAEWNKQASWIQELEDHIKKEFEVSYDMHTCPEGFKANDKTCAPYAQVPNKDSHLVLPKWVQYLDDGHITTYAMGAPIDAMLYVVDIYAEPSLDNDDKPFEPMPHWYRAAMHADEAHWQVLYKEIFKIATWGVAADLKWHRDLTRVTNGLVSRIEFMQRDLEGACQAADLCEYRLQAAHSHKYINHAQGLVNHSLCFTKQNIQAVHILRKEDTNNNNNKNKNKGKGKAV